MCSEIALEQQSVAHRQHLALSSQIEPAHDLRGRIVQAPAMRRVDRLHLLALTLQLTPGKPRIGPTFGAVTVEDVDPELGAEAGDAPGYAPVANADIVGHRNAGQPKHAIVGKAPERNRIAFGAGIADDADLGPKLGLAQREVVDVPEEAPRGRAQAMQYAKRRAHWTPRSTRLRDAVSIKRCDRQGK